MIWKAVGFRDMLAIASVICALRARGTMLFVRRWRSDIDGGRRRRDIAQLRRA